MSLFTLAVLLLSASVHCSFALVVQGTRFSLPARGQQTGATLEAISNVNLTGTLDRVDIRYVANVSVNGQNFRVLIDTGSSDLWIVPPQDFQFKDTGIPVDDGFTGGDVSGTIGFASVELGGYTFDSQAFNSATEVGLSFVLDAGLDGLIGLSFDGSVLSPITEKLVESGMDPGLGEPFLFNIFDQTPGQNNFIGISLSRTDDLEGSADASFTINEFDPTYAAVANAPVNPLFPGDNGVWSILVDSISVDGTDIPLPISNVLGAPEGKVVATMDTGTPYAAVNGQILDAIYSQIPGAISLQGDADGFVWAIPCNTTTIVSVQIGGQPFPIHPLDLSDVFLDNSTNSPVCKSPWHVGQTDSRQDIVWGDSFMRNVYSIFNFGDTTSRSPNPNSSMQLLSQTDPTSAAQDVLTVRMALLAGPSAPGTNTTSSQGGGGGGGGGGGSGSGSGGGGGNPAEKKSDGPSTFKTTRYAPIAVGFFGGSVLAGFINWGF